MSTNLELSRLHAEAAELSTKLKLTPQEKRRFGYLSQAIPYVKNGGTLAKFDQERHNDFERENGLPQTRFRTGLTNEQRAKAQLMIDMVKNGVDVGGRPIPGGVEFRAETEGNILAQLGTYTGLGSFVPTDLFGEILCRMAEYDVLFDKDGPCTVIESDNARPLRVTMYDDTGVDAVQISEGGTEGAQTNLGLPYSVTIGSYSYRTSTHKVSMETFDDISETFAFEQLFESFSSKRLARGIGAKLMTGNGIGTTTGLLTALEASGIVPIVGQGSSANDGVGTASGSIGSQDFENLIYGINEVYRENESTGFLMNSSTLASAASVLDKMGHPIELVKWIGRKPYIFGFPVYVCPTLPSLGANSTPVIFGDLSYWVTRIVVGGPYAPKVRILKEAAGLIENGLYGAQALMRADGALVWDNANNENPPLVYLECHS